MVQAWVLSDAKVKRCSDAASIRLLPKLQAVDNTPTTYKPRGNT